MAYMEVIKDGKVVKRKPMDDAVAERGCVINLGKIGKARLAVGESAKIGEYRVRVCSGEMPPEPLASRKTLVDRSPDVLDAAGAGREEPPVKFPKIEGFRVTGQLGAGGMGAVWRAVQLSTQREVALKILHVGRFGSKRARIRFEREVELAARLEHPNIARVYDSGLHHNDYYYAMELVDGAGLDKYVETNNLTPKQVFALIRTICRAIAHAHGFGVIHRDLKPSNILVTPDGQPHVLDFGLAKTLEPDESSIQVSIEGETSGTPAFMSPEQAAGHHSKVDGRTDVYSLGVITFRLLTGEYPHEMSGSHFEIIRRIVETEARRPRDLSETIDREIEAILLKALAHDKDDRYDTADQMADDIGNYLSGKPIMARAPMPLYRLRKAARRNRTALLIGAAVALLIAGIALFAYHKISDAERARTTGHDRLAKERGTEAERVAQLEKLLEENKAKSAQSEAEWNRRLAAAKTDKERAELLAAKAREDAARQARLNETAPKVPKVQQTTTIAGAEFMGDWQGTRKVSGNRSPIVAQVIALGNGQHRANILGEFDKRAPPIEVLTGNTQGRKLILSGGGWTAEIENGKFTGSGGGCTFEMTRTTRLSPTIGAKPPQKAIVLLGSNTTDLDTQWKSARGDGACTWNLLPGGVMRSVLKSGSIISRQDFGDHRIHLEFRTMFKPNSKGQKRSNSGVYVQGRLEVQVLDSYGLEGKFDECGAIYKMAAPLVNMCAPPLQWQTYDIDFKAAEMDGKKIVKPARINVIHNGVKIHDNLELTRHSEQAISSGIGPRGGLYLQEFGSVVEYRNIWVTESKNVPGNVNTGQTAQNDTDTKPIPKPGVPPRGRRGNDPPPDMTDAQEIKITGKYIIFPVSNKGKRSRMTIMVGDQLVHNLDCSFPAGRNTIDWWTYLDMSEYIGKTAKVSAKAAPAIRKLFESSDNIRHLQPLYDEALRPQFHMSQMRGWNNDPNGMFYHDGQYHFFWQCNPAGHTWANMYWGHATSPDMVHWTEHDRALRPFGGNVKNCHPKMAVQNCFSGSGHIDVNNTAGWQKGSEKTMVLAFTDTGCGESLAYSTDRGKTWKYYEGNPVIKHSGRDPKLMWYKPGKHWVIAVFDQEKNVGKNIAIYTSKNLKDWKLTDNIPGFFECVEIFELPVDGNPGKTKWVIFGADAQYSIGRFNGKKFVPEHQSKHRVHWGPYYASQCFNNSPDGRVVQIGWAKINMPNMPFNQTFTVPTNLTLRTTKDGVRMFATPIEELLQLRKPNPQSAQNRKLTVNASIKFTVKDQLFDILVTLKKGTAKQAVLEFGGNKATYDFTAQKLDNMPLAMENGKVTFRVLVDRPMYELIGGGGACFKTSGRRDMGKAIGTISLTAEGGSLTVESFKAYEMKSAWKSGRKAVAPKPRTTATSVASDEAFFNGKDLSNWTARKRYGAKNFWSVGTPRVDPENPKRLIVEPGGDAMVNTAPGHGRGLDFCSAKNHGDGIIELDVMIPKGSNSGIHLQGEYEIQVIDSYGRKKLGASDMGAIFLTKPPALNACGKPGEWQTFEIHFRAPKFDDKGKKTANARIEKVLLNGDLIQENVELKRPTPGGIDGQEKPLGPLMLQGYHGPVAYRNIRIKPL